MLESASDYFPHAGASEVVTFSLPNFYDNFQENKIVNEEILNILLIQIDLFFKAIN